MAPLLFGLLLGLWQVGRMIQVKQVMDSAAREGARLASQAQIIAPVGGFTEISTSTGVPNVQDTVREYLVNAGIVPAAQVNTVTVTFTFLDNFNNVSPHTDPYQGAKGERFTVTVTLPMNAVNWTPFDMSGTSLTSTVTWVILVDSPFTINTTVPSWTSP
jgi:Flp pilus assembly protein TadG